MKTTNDNLVADLAKSKKEQQQQKIEVNLQPINIELDLNLKNVAQKAIFGYKTEYKAQIAAIAIISAQFLIEC